MNIGDLSIEERIRLVEDIWDSIAAEAEKLPISEEQMAELDRRLEAYRVDQNPGSDAFEAIERIRTAL